jgi:hypothetical protein
MKNYLSMPLVNFVLSVVTALIPVAIWTGIMSARVENIEKNMIIMQKQYSDQVQVNQEIKVSLARIETDIIYIRQGLDKHLNQ